MTYGVSASGSKDLVLPKKVHKMLEYRAADHFIPGYLILVYMYTQDEEQKERKASNLLNKALSWHPSLSAM